MRYCLAPHCPALVENRVAYCPGHAPQQAPWRKKAESSGWQRGTIRRRVLRRAGYVCQVPGCHEPATEADHIVGRAVGGTDDLTNMQALCPEHHKLKTERERREGVERKKARR